MSTRSVKYRKLGGIIIDGKNLIMEAMEMAGFKMDSIDNEKVPATVTYEEKELNQTILPSGNLPFDWLLMYDRSI